VLSNTLAQWISNPGQLRAMADAALRKAVPDAGNKVSEICMEVCHG
jgi:UDP-N-acetylglucosamine:LPS N-acetylglucosamine transferase